VIDRDRRRRFSREQEDWIARAKTAPSVYKAAGVETKAIIEGLQAKYRKTYKPRG
jgi:hypothetical protein